MTSQPEQDAARAIRKLPPANVTVELWLTGYRVFFPSERSRETAEHDLSMLQPFVRRYGRKLLSAITPLMAQEWAVANRSQVRYLRSAFDKAVAMELLRVNVWDCVRLPPKPKATSERTRPPTIQQLDAILWWLRSEGGWRVEFADFVELAAFTGARLSGVARLEPADVDLAARRLRLVEKGGKERTVVLTPRAAEAAARALGRASARKWPELFVTPRGHKLDRARVGSEWSRARKAADFPGTFHSLKHFAATWLAAQGVNERDIAVQLGHFDHLGRPYANLVRRVYDHPDHEAARARIEARVGT